MEIDDGSHVAFPSHTPSFSHSTHKPTDCRIPVYVINALYIWPITLWTYLNYGRPKKPSKIQGSAQLSCHTGHGSNGTGEDRSPVGQEMGIGSPEGHEEAEKHHHHHHGSERPMFATITVAVCHCGAGCVLGDIVGEWLVYGTGAKINGRMLWVEFLVGTRSSFALCPNSFCSDHPNLQASCFPYHWRITNATEQISPSPSPSASSSNTFPSPPCPAPGAPPPSSAPPKLTSYPLLSSKSACSGGWPSSRLPSSSTGSTWRP